MGASLSAAMVALLVAVLLLQMPAAHAQSACKEEQLGLSSLIGSKEKGSVMVDHTSLADKGPITRVSLYYSRERGCLKGAKAAFGSPPAPGIIGSTADTTEKALKLEPGEVITKAEYKVGKCIEYLKLSTSKGRSVSAGRVGPVADLMTSAPTGGRGQLLAIKGSSKPNQGKKQGAMQHLQLVWGTNKCGAASTADEKLMPESGTLSDDAHAAAGACKPRVDMCNEKASMNAFTYCIWNAPFSGSSCKGGCCFSSGKCASSSCAISGMGRDVPNMICYGTNNGVGFGGSSNCAGLACRLATPGCSTDAFGGNCVGTVVPFGSRDEVHPESLKFIGAPCLDATPSDTTLDASGAPASVEQGVYMGKLWTVCDCAEGGLGLPEPAARLMNLTTTRISNFTKNEVLAALSTFLPQKNATDEANPRAKVVTLLPSFADMFKMPSLSSITLPSFLGDLTGAKAGKDGASLAPPKLPDLPGLLGQMKPPQTTGSDQPGVTATTQGLNFESASLPNGTAAEMMMVESPGAAPEKPPRTLGSLLSRFTKPKEESHADGSSTFTPGSTEAVDKSSTKVKPMNLGSLFGGLRRAGPDNSTASTPSAAGAAGNSSRKLDLSPISALITKFINGPASTPPAAAATTTAAPAAAAANPTAAAAAPSSTPAAVQSVPAPNAQPATAVKLQSVTEPAKASGPLPGPASGPTPGPDAAAPVPARGPAVLSTGGRKTIKVGGPASQDPPAAEPSDSAADVPTDANGRPLTLAERVRAKKAAKDAAKDAGDSSSSSSSSNSTATAVGQPEAQKVQRIRKQGFSANLPMPPLPRPEDDPIFVATGMNTATLLYNLLGLTDALRSGTNAAGADDLTTFGTLLGQLQQVPGGLPALPADVSAALMELAAEVNKVTSGGAPAAPAAAATADAAANASTAAPAAAPAAAAAAAAAAKPAEQPAKAAQPDAEQKQAPPAAAAGSSAKDQSKFEQPVKAATAVVAAETKPQQPVKAVLASAPATTAATITSSSIDSKEQHKPQQPALAAAAAVKKDDAKAPVTAQPASKAAVSSSRDSKLLPEATAPAAVPSVSTAAAQQPAQQPSPAAGPAAGKGEAAASGKDSKPAAPTSSAVVASSSPAAAAAAAAAAASPAAKPAAQKARDTVTPSQPAAAASPAAKPAAAAAMDSKPAGSPQAQASAAGSHSAAGNSTPPAVIQAVNVEAPEPKVVSKQ